jgi:hypothetical protein
MNDYYKNHYAQIVGLTVISVEFNEEDGEVFPTLLMGRETGDKTIDEKSLVWVALSRDAEGNGGGHAFIEPVRQYQLEI